MDDRIKKIVLKGGVERYRFKIDIGKDPVTGRRRQETHTYDSLTEAETELSKIIVAVAKDIHVAPSPTTVNEILNEWLDFEARNIEESTLQNYVDAVKPVRALYGEQPAQSLTEKHVERLIDWMWTSGRTRNQGLGPGLSCRTIDLTLGRLRQALKYAQRKERVHRNAAEYVSIPRQYRKEEKARKGKRQCWNTAEIRLFITLARCRRLFAIFLLSLMGLRPAEVCGLRWDEHIDFEKLLLYVGSNTRTLSGTKIIEKDAKTRAGVRALPLPRFIAKALMELKRRQRAEMLKAGDAYVYTGYVLVDELGQPQRPDWLRRRAQWAMKSAKLRKVRLYDCRHACLTYLASRGVPDWVLAAWAGHADGGELAKRVYVQPDHTHLQVAADALDELFDEKVPDDTDLAEEYAALVRDFV
ncbi:site-specific integrase [Allokutzneria multivorans]|uniref:Site-specific integrase n=1 Tax=Allokutzneria multivorans TaxID=1142134 RepID=A0ABP7SBN9_9PSEU